MLKRLLRVQAASHFRSYLINLLGPVLNPIEKQEPI
jgi:hypothetical protein